MRKRSKKIRKLLINALAITVCVFGVTTAWATLKGTVETQDDSTAVSSNSVDGIIADLSHRAARARAPEPSSITLFGSGILGMIVSFVRRTYALAKRLFDILVSVTAFVILSPLFLFAALLIKITSPGPVVFTQTRVGKEGSLFTIYKFRTMHINAEEESGPVWAKADDPRLIPGGKFLRKSHIDELPQFLNVLRGEMSFIGPRPERPEFVEKFKKEILDYEKRLDVKPGITGLAQVWHRYDETIADVRKKIKYDLLYIKRLCLWTDLSILLRTFRVVVTGEGAR